MPDDEAIVTGTPRFFSRGEMLGHERLDAAMKAILISPSLEIPLRQRAKFEGWMKIELARELEKGLGVSVSLEFGYETESAACRADLLLQVGDLSHLIMLKTVNTNFRFDGVEAKTRPITKNIAGVIEDVEKLRACKSPRGCGYVCFPIFPVSTDAATRSAQVGEYLKRIEASGTKFVVSNFLARASGWGAAWYVGEVKESNA